LSPLSESEILGSAAGQHAFCRAFTLVYRACRLCQVLLNTTFLQNVTFLQRTCRFSTSILPALSVLHAVLPSSGVLQFACLPMLASHSLPSNVGCLCCVSPLMLLRTGGLWCMACCGPCRGTAAIGWLCLRRCLSAECSVRLDGQSAGLLCGCVGF
jgi:hypothetical protein